LFIVTVCCILLQRIHPKGKFLVCPNFLYATRWRWSSKSSVWTHTCSSLLVICSSHACYIHCKLSCFSDSGKNEGKSI